MEAAVCRWMWRTLHADGIPSPARRKPRATPTRSRRCSCAMASSPSATSACRWVAGWAGGWMGEGWMHYTVALGWLWLSRLASASIPQSCMLPASDLELPSFLPPPAGRR